MQGLGVLPGHTYSTASDVSADGGVVVGTSVVVVDTGSVFEAYRWAPGGMQGLGVAPGDVFSTAYGVSGDGAVVVGVSHEVDGTGAMIDHPSRWTSATGMVRLGGFPGDIVGGRALAASADGGVVVGQALRLGIPGSGFRWTGGQVQLIGAPGTAAFAVSADGAIVVGTTVGGAFRWTQDTGIEVLEDFPGGATAGVAFGVSDDGRVIAGVGFTAVGGEAFVWTEAAGMRRLHDILVERGVDLTGWLLREVRGLSADGRTVAGWGINPAGQVEAFRAFIGGHRWINPVGGSWEDAANWSPASVPGVSDPVAFDLDATYTVTGGAFAAGPRSVPLLVADAGTVDFSLDNLALTAAGAGLDAPPSLSVSFDATAKIVSGTATFVHGWVGYGRNEPGDTTTVARLQVFNDGTILDGSENLTVGHRDGGRGEVFVAAGTLRSRHADLGFNQVGEAVVGNGGTWTVADALFLGLGVSGVGRLLVEAGGAVTARTVAVNALADPRSLVDVSGTGPAGRSRLFVTDTLFVGDWSGSGVFLGPGVLRVRGGGEVTADVLTVRATEERSRVLVDGAAGPALPSELVANDVTIGQGAGFAELAVVGGGRVLAGRLFVANQGTDGLVLVGGGGPGGFRSALHVERAGFEGRCFVGIGGSGLLLVRDGAEVICDEATVGSVGAGEVFVGPDIGPERARLVVSRRLYVGDGAPGRLALAGGLVDAVNAAANPPADSLDVVVGGPGRIEGFGTVIGRVSNAGVIGPLVAIATPPAAASPPRFRDPPPTASRGGDPAAGTLLVLGRVAFAPGSTLAIPLAGPDTTQQGRLRVRPGAGAPGLDGSAALAGTLRLDFSGGYAPLAGDTFMLLDAASATGTFTAVEVLGLEPGWQFTVEVENGTVVLTSLSDGTPTTAGETAPEPAASAPRLRPPRPNPSSGRTTLAFELAQAGPARLIAYDPLGREVAVVVDAEWPAGAHEATLDAHRLAPGVYVLRLEAGAGVATRRLVVAR